MVNERIDNWPWDRTADAIPEAEHVCGAGKARRTEAEIAAEHRRQIAAAHRRDGLSPGRRVTEAMREAMPARECHIAMLQAWEEKYGPVVLATDAEVRAASRLTSREVAQ